jgi:hypothetical protein
MKARHQGLLSSKTVDPSPLGNVPMLKANDRIAQHRDLPLVHGSETVRETAFIHSSEGRP